MSRLLPIGAFALLALCLAMLAGIIGSMPVVPWARDYVQQRWTGWRLPLAETAGAVALLGVFVAALLQVAARTYNPFIYFRF